MVAGTKVGSDIESGLSMRLQTKSEVTEYQDYS